MNDSETAVMFSKCEGKNNNFSSKMLTNITQHFQD